MKTYLKNCHWFIHWFLWTFGIICLGAAVGALTFPLIGFLISSKITAGALLILGAKKLGFYFGIWAPGIGIVTTVMRARENFDAKKARL